MHAGANTCRRQQRQTASGEANDKGCRNTKEYACGAGGATYNETQGRERMGMGAGRVGTVMRMGMGTRWGLGMAAQGRQKCGGGAGGEYM